MNPYYQDDAVTIYHGDALDVMAGLDPVDSVLTDPPYGIVNGASVGTHGRVRHGAMSNSVAEAGWNAAPDKRWVDLAAGLASKWFVVWCGLDPAAAADYHGRLTALKWRSRTGFALIKSNPRPTLNPWFASSTEVAWIFSHPDGSARFQHPRGSCIPRHYVTALSPAAGRLHPAQKPIEPMSLLLTALVPVGGCVLDPFMGSGTTLRAAKDHGRKAIGVEIDEAYCEIAAKRMGQEVLAFG